mgnify:FL=1
MLVLKDKNHTKTAQTPSVESVADKIIKYKQLLDEGIITEEDFSAKKRDFLASRQTDKAAKRARGCF